MKNLFLGLMLLAGTVSFANTNAKAVNKQVNTIAVTKCYRAAVDPFGNKYYVEVACPKTIILQ